MESIEKEIATLKELAGQLMNKEMEITAKLGAEGQGLSLKLQAQPTLPPTTVTREMTFSKYNEDTKFEIPDEVGVLLGLTPYLGVHVAAQAGVNGLVITEVVPGSAVDRAGLGKGDIIKEFASQPVTDEPGFRKLIRQHKVGDEVKIKILSGDGEELEFTLKLEAHPESE